jgi:hypothetical protein
MALTDSFSACTVTVVKGPDTAKGGAMTSNRRTRTLDVRPLPGEAYAFVAILLDESFGGAYEAPQQDSIVVHRFAVEGVASGRALTLDTLRVNADEHPFPACPRILPAADALIGLSLVDGWRANVLERFRGSAGCTHVTTLLLGLSEIISMIYFQRLNERTAYGPRSRASGEWLAGSPDVREGMRGACHVLTPDGPVLAKAARVRREDDSTT